MCRIKRKNQKRFASGFGTLRVVFSLGALIAAAAILTFLWMKFFSSPSSQQQKPTVNENVNTFVESIDAALPLDTDRDGLADEEETSVGTNIQDVDSDDDGLNDREEVQTFRTQPLSKDSDRDGYEDGQEVEGGYDPLGPGRLFDFEQGITNLNP